MIRALIPFGLLAATALPAPAAAQAPFYVAVPNAKPTRGVITRSAAWSPAGERLVAAAGPARPLVQCQLLARQVGALRSFTAGDVSLDEAALNKCNMRAKRGPQGMAAR